MDVTQKNFEEVYKKISEHIKNVKFVSIDTEFTGLDEGVKDYITFFDTPESRYKKLIKPASDYIIVQFGLCLVSQKADKNYEAQTYNFYVFPRPSKIVPDAKFSCQSSCLEFLSNQGLDLGKVIKEGISYLKMCKEKLYHDRLIMQHKQQINKHQWIKENSHRSSSSSSFSSSSSIPPQHEPFISKQLDSISTYLEGTSYEPLSLDACPSSFVKKLLYSVLTQRYEGRLFVKDVDENIVVIKLRNEEHFKELLHAVQQEEFEQVKRLVGFTKIIKLLHTSGKLIVGHNMMLDLLHILQQFWCNLPQNYLDFKHLLHATFPLVADTKYIASTPHFQNMTNNINLELLQSDLLKHPSMPQITFKALDDNMDTTTNFHNAAYDAYVTASCFVHMLTYLETHCKDVPSYSLHNKLFLMRMADVPFLNIVGDDSPLDREHVFHVTFTSDKKKHHLQNVFQPYGTVHIKFMSDTTAFVSLVDKKFAQDAKEALRAQRFEGFKIQPFMHYLNNTDVTSLESCAVSNENKRKLHALDVEVAMKKKKFSTKDNTALHMLSNINCNNTQHNHATNHVIVADKSSNSNSSNNISKSNDNVGTMTKNNRTSAKGESKTNNIINRALSFLKMTKQDTTKGATDFEIPEWE